MKPRLIFVCVTLATLVTFYFLYTSKNSQEIQSSSSAQIGTIKNVTPTEQPNTTESQPKKDPSKQPIEKLECQKLYSSNETAEELISSKNYALSKSIRALEKSGLNNAQLEEIGDIAGIGKKEVSLARSGLNQNAFMRNQGEIVLLADDYQTRTDMPNETRNFFDAAVTQKDYPKIIQAVQEKKINPTNIRFGKSLLTHIVQSNKDITSRDIENLLNAGFPINLDAIVYAIKGDVKSEIIIALSEKYPQSIKGEWREDDNSMNLSLAAAKALRPDLMKHFIKSGINGYTQTYSGVNTILDELPKPKNAQESKVALDIALDVLNHGGSTTRYSALKRLNSWLPEVHKQQYNSLLRTPNNISEDTIKTAAELKSILDSFDTKIAYANEAMPRCKEQHNYDLEAYIDDLVKENPSSAKLSLNDKKNIYTHLKSQQQEFFKNPEGFLKRLKNSVKNITIIKNAPETTALYTSLSAATMDKQWAKALEIAEKINIAAGNKQGYTLLLSSYLWQENPNWSFVEDLLQRGVPLDSGFMMPLARKGHVEFTEKLLAYGLDLNGVNELGENALSLAVVPRKNERMISFLIEHGVTVKPQTLGLDPLDLVLQELDSYSDMKEPNSSAPYFTTPNYVALLLKAGAPLERSHIEKIELLQEVNPQAFDALVKAVPELLTLLKH